MSLHKFNYGLCRFCTSLLVHFLLNFWFSSALHGFYHPSAIMFYSVFMSGCYFIPHLRLRLMFYFTITSQILPHIMQHLSSSLISKPFACLITFWSFNSLISNRVSGTRMSLRSPTRSLMTIPRINTVYASRSFSVCVPVVWYSRVTPLVHSKVDLL